MTQVLRGPEATASDNRLWVLALGGLTVLYIAIRCVYLDRWIMIDEVHWVGRSANFYRALWSGDLQYTFQQSHPGIMTMWAGMFAYWVRFPEYVHQINYNETWPILHVEDTLRQLGVHPGDMLVAGRISKIIMQGAFFLGSLLFVRKLLGIQIAILTGILITFDPFLSGLDSMLHVDGLFTIIAFCAVLSVAWARISGFPNWTPWAVSGAISACAWLTRLQGLIIPLIAGAFVAIALIQWFRQAEKDDSVRHIVRAGVAWLGAWVVTSLVLFPALWFSPVRTFDGLFTLSSHSVTEPHGAPVFFNGTIYREDPGLLMYPAGIVWHMTPVTMVGLVLFALTAIRLWRRREGTASTWIALGTLAVFCVIYFIGMSASAKKLDRYMLPLFPTLELAAACGFFWAVQLVTIYRQALTRFAFPAVATLLLFVQGVATVGVLPYRLEYYNPLFGGSVAAKDMFRFGYGEGADQVQDFVILNADPNDDRVVTASSGADLLYTWIDQGIDSRFVFGPEYTAWSPQGWYEIDYYALGFQETQVNGYTLGKDLAAYEPIKRVTIEGVENYTIYPLNTYPFPEGRVRTTACTVDFAPGLKLLQIARSGASLDLYFLSTELISTDQVTVTVGADYFDPAGNPLSTTVDMDLEPGQSGYLSKLSIPFAQFGSGNIETVESINLSAVDMRTGTPFQVSKPGDLLSSTTANVLTGCWDQE